VLAPFRYLEIFGSILLGALIFDHLPDVLTCVGTAFIIGSGFYVFRREQILARRHSAEAAGLAPRAETARSRG
jgi:drug/metabolite transporter (DMT)-like permease